VELWCAIQVFITFGIRNWKEIYDTDYYELAMAASWDAGNRSMRKSGRSTWNQDDYKVAAKEFERIYKA